MIALNLMESAVGPFAPSTSPSPPAYSNGNDAYPSQVTRSVTDGAISSSASRGDAPLPIETNNASVGGAHLDSAPSGFSGGPGQQPRLDTRAILSSSVSKVSAFKGVQENAHRLPFRSFNSIYCALFFLFKACNTLTKSYYLQSGV